MTDTKFHICIVEDDPIMGESLCDRLTLEGFSFDWHRKAMSARASIGMKHYDAVISDIRLPDLGGDEMFLQLAQDRVDLPPFIFITGFGSIDRAVQLIKRGAADYVTKPFDLEQLIERVRSLCRPALSTPESGPVLGVSPQMRRIEALLPSIARKAQTLLITGDSGVGKEWIAQEFDRLARGTDKCPFVPVNCSAIPEGLLESELFGHEKGAFTGATRARKGVFEQADCGTLFLDEIGDMSLPMQAKLLRAIQERRIQRVGGETAIDVSLRLICATNRDLKDMVQKGQFREDLYYRINVIHIHVPPLRERKEDILWLCRRFLDDFAQDLGGDRRLLSTAAEQALLTYPWPGNVRELRHCVERAFIMSPKRMLEPDAFFDEVPSPPETGGFASLSDYIRECEHRYILRALHGSAGRIGAAAEKLGISRKNLWEKMKKLGIEEGKAEPD